MGTLMIKSDYGFEEKENLSLCFHSFAQGQD